MALKIIGAEGGVAERIEAAIRGAIPDAQVQVRAGGAAHFELQVVAEAFRGKSMVQQHQLVYGVSSRGQVRMAQHQGVDYFLQEAHIIQYLAKFCMLV